MIMADKALDVQTPSSWWHHQGLVWDNLYKSLVKRINSSVVYAFFFSIFLISAFVFFKSTVTPGGSSFYRPIATTTTTTTNKTKLHPKICLPLNCSGENPTACRNNYPTTYEPIDTEFPFCPDYFRWIHEDLKPWKKTGITRDMLRKATEKTSASFGLVILNGKLYIDKYRNSYQTRDVFTIWGFLQLLRLYPGMVPDLELKFWCEDRPAIDKRWHKHEPPPLFHYCGHESTLDIVFPDWSFWGWPEVNIKPWQSILKDIKEGNNKTKWMDRVPYAYWKGNPAVSWGRVDLLKCNASINPGNKAYLYKQDWGREIQQGFEHSNLADQCTHRYKIYAEGQAWSVSEKYIMACDSMSLLIKPEYYDFFGRNMVPTQHYWPINPKNKCRDINFAVEWGNHHTDKAQVIANKGSEFIQESVKMNYVYDYMLHLLREYAKLLKFEPEIPKNAKEVCVESLACSADGTVKKFMEESMINSPSEHSPCILPPAFGAPEVMILQQEKDKQTKKVEKWEREYWEKVKH